MEAVTLILLFLSILLFISTIAFAYNYYVLCAQRKRERERKKHKALFDAILEEADEHAKNMIELAISVHSLKEHPEPEEDLL